MGFNIISAAEAASYIKHGYNIGLSGFTPAGSPKAVTPEIAKIAEAEHAAGRPFQIGIFTGASTGDATDGVLTRANAIRYRAPYTTNGDFRKSVNNGEIAYNDIHLSQMAQEIRYGFLGKVDVAILEACDVTPDGKVYLTAAGGISPTIARLADKIIIEVNAAHRGNQCIGLHDVYEPLDPPYRREIPIFKSSDRIGTPYLQVDPAKIVGIVEVNIPDEARGFTAPDPVTDKIGQNVADFLLADMKRGIIPSTFLPLQSGVGNIANAVLGALGSNKDVPAFEMYTEVLQESVVDLIRAGRVKFGSTCSLSVTNECLQGIYDDFEFFKDKLLLRPSEISNNPEIIRRLGVISMNTAIEADIYGIKVTALCPLVPCVDKNGFGVILVQITEQFAETLCIRFHNRQIRITENFPHIALDSARRCIPPRSDHRQIRSRQGGERFVRQFKIGFIGIFISYFQILFPQRMREKTVVTGITVKPRFCRPFSSGAG